MANSLTADDIVPLIAGLAPQERLRLIRLITQRQDADEASIYAATPALAEEFSSDDDALAWEGEGWEEFD